MKLNKWKLTKSTFIFLLFGNKGIFVVVEGQCLVSNIVYFLGTLIEVFKMPMLGSGNGYLNKK